LLRRELPNYDVIVNAILWDSSRNDHIIYHEDLKRMKKGAMIIDISCDRNGGIESSIPTTIQDPVYSEGGILHYVVDHTPSLFYKTSSASISSAVYSYIDRLIEGDINDVLRNALYAKNGVVIK
ncbi:MAG TPA: N(5)-(carboxyethyl)ornithine synthase, partial [Lachnospiraceae bacterium]|nr:N(5)-(carboxyethyl)ornithine synthase [Lachnospiraceae bacterium]